MEQRLAEIEARIEAIRDKLADRTEAPARSLPVTPVTPSAPEGERYRKDMEAVRTDLKTALGEVLNEDQLEAFEKSGYGRHAMGHPIIITSDSVTTDGAQTIQIDLSGQ